MTKTWKKVLLGVGALAVVGIGSSIYRYQTTKDVTTIQTGKVTRDDLTSLVTASGEIKPRTYTNVLGEGFGKITDIVVKEGDRVKRGDVLLKLESVQPGADVDAQRAAIQSAEDALSSAEANFRSAEATVAQRKATFEGADLDWQRGQELYKAGLIPKQDYDTRRATFDGAKAGLVASQAQMQQARSDREKARATMDQQKHMLTRLADVLRKTTYIAPIDGIVSYIAVRVGENVVPGIQNSSGSYLMTISDMSVVTAEVMADETDIVNVHPGQVADVVIDAIPGKIFKGRVTEMGDQAIIRSTGLATTQTQASNQEAKDFKVVVTLDDPPLNVRPGLSTTAKIQTAQEKGVLSIPLQSLALRTRKDLDDAQKEAEKKKSESGSVVLAAAKPAAPGADPKKEEIQGVFVVRGGRVQFVQVETGIAGITNIQVKSGLKEGDEIVTGSYKALRSLKPGAKVKVDNTTPQKDEKS
ncbi:MAG TPA: efflux RND transporter periplasmic adaptor subunit [Candidatus Binatia bacterium]|nr:efflux RND transporter periplasmic adaptor subunit [Candidatus Binatia bacterium]